MIRRLRELHRRVFISLALVLPPGFAIALAVRPAEVPPTQELPFASTPSRAGSLPDGPGVVLYWSASAPADAGALPADAWLVRPGPDGLLKPPREGSGYWIAYSLGHAEVTGFRPVSGDTP